MLIERRKQEAAQLIHEWFYAPREGEHSKWRLVVRSWSLTTILERSYTDGMGGSSWTAVPLGHNGNEDGVAALEAAVCQLTKRAV